MTIPEWIAALRRRGVTGADIARAAGVSPSAVSMWRLGRYCPNLAHAAAIAEAFDADGFVESVREARTRACAGCGQRFVHDPTLHPQFRFCSKRCESRVNNDRIRGPRKRNHIMALTRDLELMTAERDRLQAAVDAFCRACEPSGLCRDATSPLRDVSPLPLADARLRIA